MLKAFFVLDIFKFLPQLIDCLGKRLGKKTIIDFKVYDVTEN